MKIIHVITSFALGGAERVACDLAAGQVARRHSVSIVALRRTPPGQEGFAAAMLTDLRQKGVETINLKVRNFRSSILYLILSLARIVRRKKPDILHAHVDHAELIVSIVSRLTQSAVVRTIHNTVLWPTHPVAGWLAEHAFRGEYVVAVSTDAMAAYERTRARFGLQPAHRRKVIYNGVPLRPMMERAAPGRRLKLAFFGRNTPQKGLDTLCQAVNIVAQRGRVLLHIDFYTDAMREEIPVTSTEKITLNLYSPTPTARSIMANYDALVVPSRFEGFGLVAVEAMMSGVPVILTDAPGLREVTPRGWPLLLPVGDAAALADRIDEIGAGQHDLIALGKIARAFAGQFSSEAQIENYMTVYRELLGSEGRVFG